MERRRRKRKQRRKKQGAIRDSKVVDDIMIRKRGFKQRRGVQKREEEDKREHGKVRLAEEGKNNGDS